MATALPAFTRFGKAKWLRPLLVLVLVSTAITLLTCVSCWANAEQMATNFTVTLAFTTALSLANGYAVNWLERYVSWRAEPVKRLILTLLLSLLVSLVVILGINLCYVVLYRGYAVAVLWEPPAARNIVFPLGVTVLFSLVMHSRSFLLKWREALVQTERLQKEMAQAAAETLRQQLDPHFMFNALNALTSLVEEEPQLAVRFIRQLSQVYRYVLDARGREVVLLADELEFAKAYLFLQRIRYGEALQADLPAPGSVPARLIVPPLSLQLLLENALKHNVALQQQPLHIGFELNLAARQLTVRNTLRPRRLGSEETSGLGLRNLQARYAFLTKQPMLIQPTATEFVVTLPLLELG
ncbi:signal transduction histidine kinase, LytS [Hymenobacter roseosalivarius DSM 11622]|uniref:Signal transduction histidine kinase, LytS n=1 Tax=Hymenobacter roseosalivarius DSM 11622 TaxID=645990 RepID=A0A1W1VXA1_9BACT|nr:histidine kinase [Hymenobacter roseosalivarius]SMB97958.1 signal transduction histidine kinase, LytS [Hymenobacter roseosalivarius DSM 11622]